MKLCDARILLTGAAGGIGSAIARELGQRGASLLLTDIDAAALAHVTEQLAEARLSAQTIATDITSHAGRAVLVSAAERSRCNVLINVAGLNPFGLLEQQTEAQIELAFRINALAPILLCRALLPLLERNAPAHIVNLGSTFGSIGYPGFTTYSASKFAVRGFSEALRRELHDTGVRVHYVAPRATRTRLVTERISQMNTALRIRMDSPEAVARALARTLIAERSECHLGASERSFARLNGLFPGLLDRFIAKQLPIIRRYAQLERQPTADQQSRIHIHQNA